MKAGSLALGAVVLGSLGAAGYGLYWLGMNHGMSMTGSTTASGTPASASAAADGAAQQSRTERRVLYWHDPMVPGTKFDKPGKSPFMDMQLVPVYADEAADEGKTTISPRVQQNLGIRTAEVKRGSLPTTVTAVGSVAYNERDVALVQARTGGFVERLHVRAPLDRVRKDQPLVDLYIPEWIAAQEEFFSVRRMQGRGADALVDAARQRMRLAGMRDEQIRIIEASGSIQPRFTITAPLGGVVTELMVREGMTVMPGASLFRINGVETIWINAEVPESLAAFVRPGASVEATTPAAPGRSFRGRVAALLPEVNPQTRTIKARIELANPSGQLAPGMFATLNFTATERNNVLLVPTESVIRTGQRSVVITMQDDGKFAPANVEIGAEADGQTEIRNGLTAGQKVVVSGQFLIDSEASLRATMTRMSEPPAAQTPPAPPGPAGTHRGEAKVERIDKDEVTLSHGPIPSIKWGPMTMGFKLPASGMPVGVKVGDDVRFEFRQAQHGGYAITSIAPAAPADRSSESRSGAKP